MSLAVQYAQIERQQYQNKYQETDPNKNHKVSNQIVSKPYVRLAKK
jgi:hypothetical protein